MWVPVFGLPEIMEEVLDKGVPGVFRYGRLHRIIDGAFAVLNLCVSEMGREEVGWRIPVGRCVFSWVWVRLGGGVCGRSVFESVGAEFGEFP